MVRGRWGSRQSASENTNTELSSSSVTTHLHHTSVSRVTCHHPAVPPVCHVSRLTTVTCHVSQLTTLTCHPPAPVCHYCHVSQLTTVTCHVSQLTTVTCHPPAAPADALHVEAVLDDAETRAGGDVPQPQRAVPAGGHAVRPAEAHTADLRTALRTPHQLQPPGLTLRKCPSSTRSRL